MQNSPGKLAVRACLAEVMAPKAGNVYPGAPFEDADWEDFASSAMSIAPTLDRAADIGVGWAILQCVTATQDAIGHNTNLGIILLLTPLCAASSNADLPRVLAALDEQDTQHVYEAIRLASPSGLNEAADDVRHAPPEGLSLIDAMRQAADRDTVARQYVNGFEDVFYRVAADLASLVNDNVGLIEAIRIAHLRQMAREPDSLIRRKCGDDLACESQARARRVLDGDLTFEVFDAWLREDGHRRNPGTSADLIAAGLFVNMRDHKIEFPQRWTMALSSCDACPSV